MELQCNSFKIALHYNKIASNYRNVLLRNEEMINEREMNSHVNTL